MNPFFYRVEHFIPRERIEGEAEHWGFNILLEREFARAVFAIEMSDQEHNKFQEIGEKIISRTPRLTVPSPPRPPYFFVDNKNQRPTWLLQGCEVPGIGCTISAGYHHPINFSNDSLFLDGLAYSPHNVDSFQQAGALFSLWNQWALYAWHHLKRCTEQSD